MSQSVIISDPSIFHIQLLANHENKLCEKKTQREHTNHEKKDLNDSMLNGFKILKYFVA